MRPSSCCGEEATIEAVLHLIADLANEDDLIGFSCAVIILSRAKPSNVCRVIAAVPGKVVNILIKHRGIFAKEFIAWERANSNWPDLLTQTVQQPGAFAATVGGMVEDIKNLARNLARRGTSSLEARPLHFSYAR